jgi:hypothetical protein
MRTIAAAAIKTKPKKSAECGIIKGMSVAAVTPLL